MTHLMPTTTHIIVEGTTKLFHDHVYKLHGLPKVIVSDMNVEFTSRSWNALHGLLGTMLAMSIALYPQIDGQTERVNCIIKDIL